MSNYEVIQKENINEFIYVNIVALDLGEEMYHKQSIDIFNLLMNRTKSHGRSFIEYAFIHASSSKYESQRED